MHIFRTLLVLSAWTSLSVAWMQPMTFRRPALTRSPTRLSRLMTASALDPQKQSQDNSDYEYVEYDYLTEADFLGSEWVVGTLYNDAKDIKETWVRLGRSEDGKNVCYWGTKDEGTWSLDVASQFLSISRTKFYGKEIWACTVDDYYYLQGTVRGWSFWQAASVYGQWQGIRLGVDSEEAGPAPWFQEENADSKDDDKKE